MQRDSGKKSAAKSLFNIADLLSADRKYQNSQKMSSKIWVVNRIVTGRAITQLFAMASLLIAVLATVVTFVALISNGLLSYQSLVTDNIFFLWPALFLFSSLFLLVHTGWNKLVGWANAIYDTVRPSAKSSAGNVANEPNGSPTMRQPTWEGTARKSDAAGGPSPTELGREKANLGDQVSPKTGGLENEEWTWENIRRFVKEIWVYA